MIAGSLKQDIHLWLGDFAALPGSIAPNVCSPAEHMRAGQFAARGDGERYLQSRTLLRHLLCAYLGQPPEAIAIEEGRDGKPCVRDAALSFNLSHSGTRIVVAIRECGAVGVDVQRAREVDELAIARTLFARGEIALLEGMDRTDRRQHFYRIWTCREAVLKAAGLGMKGRGLTLQPGPEATYQVAPGPGRWSAMHIHEFAPDGDTFGALCWEAGASGKAANPPGIRQFAV